MSGALRALREVGVSFTEARMLVLCYHEVRSAARFADQVSVLVDGGYSLAPMEALIDGLRRGESPPTRTVVLTFDGGYRSQLDNALPTLAARNVRATFFPATAGLDGGAIGRGDLVALAADGHTIACHTHTHPDLTRLSPQGVRREVMGSKVVLEDLLGRAVTVFGYPDGRRNATVVAAVRRAGFEVAFTIDLGGIESGDDPYQLRRIAILGEPGPREFARLMTGTRILAGATLIGWKIRERLWAMAPAIATVHGRG